MKRFALTLAMAALAPAAAFAQVDTSEWKCEFCPFQTGYHADVDAGASYVSEDVARFGNGEGRDEKGAYADVSGDGRYVDGSRFVAWHAEDLGLDSRLLELSAGKAGSFNVAVGWRETPYRLFGDTRTVYSGNSESLSLPAGWVTASNTQLLTALPSSLMSRAIETDRQRLDVGVDYRPTRRVTLYADYRREQRDGTDIMSGSAFTNAVYLPRPVDDYTDTMDVGARFMLGDLHVTAAWYGSFYRNDLESLTWDNPWTPLPGAAQGRLALEPDNDFQQVSLSGVYRSSFFDTVIGFSVASGRGEQDASLLPYTINSVIAAPALPVTSLDAEVDTSNYAFSLTSRPLGKARIRLSYRYDERDNKTPVFTWSRIITDSFVSGASEDNTPYSFERGRLDASASYRLFDDLTISGGYERTDYDRDFQEVASQTEDRGWGKLRWRPSASLEITVEGGAARREIDEYDTDVGLTLGQNPLLRKYNLAHRYREFAEAGLHASLGETPLSVSATYFRAKDDYSKSELGLVEGEDSRATIDLSYAASESSSIYLAAGSQSLQSVQLGSETFAGPVWQADHDDDFVFYGGGFTLNGLREKIDLAFDYTRSEGNTEIRYSGIAVAATPLPELESTLGSLRMTMRYRVSERLDLNLRARYEKLEAADWALQDVGPATIPAVLTMGANPYDYDVWVFGLSVSYRIGD